MSVEQRARAIAKNCAEMLGNLAELVGGIVGVDLGHRDEASGILGRSTEDGMRRKRLTELETENARLKKLAAEKALDLEAVRSPLGECVARPPRPQIR